MTEPNLRYARQVQFPGIGVDGQARIGRATVGLVGLGALGSTLAELIVRAGVGRLIAVDRDIVDATNLHRQSLYADDDAALRIPKATAAARRLRDINGMVQVDARAVDFSAENALELFADCDLLLDGADGFETRYLMNDLAIDLNIPWIYGACIGATAMSAVIIPGVTPCLTCLFPEPPPPGSTATCDTAGIISPAATIAASLQVAEALKLLAGRDDVVRRSLVSVELWPFRTVEFGSKASRPNPDCSACGQRNGDFLRGARRGRAESLCGRDTVQVRPARPLGVTLRELAERLRSLGALRETAEVLFFSADGFEMSLFPDGRALIHGATDIERARAFYTRYVGD